MKVDGKHCRPVWLDEDGWSVRIIDQTRLPHRFVTRRLIRGHGPGIRDMQVGGAPLIGATAAR